MGCPGSIVIITIQQLQISLKKHHRTIEMILKSRRSWCQVPDSVFFFKLYFSYQPQFPLPPSSCSLTHLPSTSYTHSSSFQKGAGLLCEPTNHCLSSWCRTRLLSLPQGLERHPSLGNWFQNPILVPGIDPGPTTRVPTNRPSHTIVTHMWRA